MAKLLLTLLIFCSTTSFGQSATDIRKRAQDFQDSLTKNNVDTLLDYTLECVGYYHIDSCNIFDGHYIFLKQNDKIFLQRIDDCNTYKTLLLDTANPLTFYIVQKKKIDHEIIYPPTYFQSKPKPGEPGIAISQSIDHTCFNEMTFLIKTKKIFRSVSEYDLTFKKFDNGRKNKYYNYNQQTQLKKLIDQIAQLVQQMDIDKKFEVR